jgi:uncharacterized protein (UPF0333 family)
MGVIKTLVRFFKESRAQGAIEYILLAGGIIVAAIVIFAIYSSLTKSAGGKLNESVESAAQKMQEAITNATQNITA